MMKKIITAAFSIFLLTFVALGGVYLSPEPVAAQKDAACESIGGCNETDGNGVYDLLKTGLNILSIVAGTVAVVMIIIAGFKFITSQGDSGAITSARNTVLYAVIGIVIVALSQIIVQFVLSETSSISYRDEKVLSMHLRVL